MCHQTTTVHPQVQSDGGHGVSDSYTGTRFVGLSGVDSLPPVCRRGEAPQVAGVTCMRHTDIKTHTHTHTTHTHTLQDPSTNSCCHQRGQKRYTLCLSATAQSAPREWFMCHPHLRVCKYLRTGQDPDLCPHREPRGPVRRRSFCDRFLRWDEFRWAQTSRLVPTRVSTL